MGMQHATDLGMAAIKGRVQQCLGRRALAGGQAISIQIHQHNVVGCEAGLVTARDGNRDAAGIHAGGKITAGSRYPAARVELAAQLEQGFRLLAESTTGSVTGALPHALD